MENKKAGFWIKLLSRLLDLLPIAVLAIGVAYVIMKHTPLVAGGPNVWHFVEPWSFYAWGLFLIAMLVLQLFLIPILTKGQTFGQWVARIKVQPTSGSVTSAIIKRETFFGGVWILSAILVLTVINHTLITNFAARDKEGFTPNAWENLRIGLVSAVGSMGALAQMVIGISVLVRKDKAGLHDRYANAIVVYKNKMVKVVTVKKTTPKEIKPRPVKNADVEWL